jgi:hypothetical protein
VYWERNSKTLIIQCRHPSDTIQSTCTNKRSHLCITDGQLQLRCGQLGRLAVYVGPVQHAADEGRGGWLVHVFSWQAGTACHRSRARRRAVPGGRPDDGPPLAAAADDAQVGRYLLQHRRPLVPEPADAPAGERANDEAGSKVMGVAHRSRTKFKQSGKLGTLYNPHTQ